MGMGSGEGSLPPIVTIFLSRGLSNVPRWFVLFQFIFGMMG
jgi:hypothetical protein